MPHVSFGSVSLLIQQHSSQPCFKQIGLAVKLYISVLTYNCYRWSRGMRRTSYTLKHPAGETRRLSNNTYIMKRKINTIECNNPSLGFVLNKSDRRSEVHRIMFCPTEVNNRHF